MHTITAVSASAPRFHDVCTESQARLIQLSFDQDYYVGQELGVSIEDEFFLYRVSQNDVECGRAEMQARVARGVLVALVNGGFTGFPTAGATLAGNTLSVLRADRPAIPCDDAVWACNLWSN